MRYENIINILISIFPELQNKYEDEKDYIEGLPHLVFEIVFVPFIREVFTIVNHNRRVDVINLLEEMINCDDEKVQEIVIVSVLESIVSERELIEKIRYDLGTKTKESLKVIEKTYGWI